MPMLKKKLSELEEIFDSMDDRMEWERINMEVVYEIKVEKGFSLSSS